MGMAMGAVEQLKAALAFRTHLREEIRKERLKASRRVGKLLREARELRRPLDNPAGMVDT